MYFTNYNPLKEKLREQAISDRDALPYLMVFSGLIALVAAFPMIEDFNKWDFISGMTSVTLAILGVFHAYKCNGGKEGFDLIQKYVVLGWVVAFRCLLAFLPLIFVATVLEAQINISTKETGIVDMLLTAGFELFLYQRIGRHIKDTIKNNANQAELTTPTAIPPSREL